MGTDLHLRYCDDPGNHRRHQRDCIGHSDSTRPVDGPFRLAAQAQIDEAFEGVTSGNNVQDAKVYWQTNMPDGFQAKRNSSYPWGTTTYGSDELWMGTIAQGWCVWPYQNLNLPAYLTTYEGQSVRFLTGSGSITVTKAKKDPVPGCRASQV